MSTVKRGAKPKKWQHSDKYLNREYSWLQFNRRVLEEAANSKNPLLERLKFLAIFESNLDEFYMVRVSGLIEQYESGVFELSPDGMTPNEQLSLISKSALPLRKTAGEIWHNELMPQLKESGVEILTYSQLSARQKHDMHELFDHELFPVCTPLLLDPAPSVPFISNRSLNLVVVLQDEAGTVRLARVKIPDVYRRMIRVSKRRHEYVFSEDVIQQNLQALFPGVSILGSYLFRVIRDADVEIRELEAGDLIDSIEQTLRLRRFGDPVLLEVSSLMPDEVRQTLMRILKLEESDVFPVEGLIGMSGFWELASIDKPALRFAAHHPYLAESLSTASQVFSAAADGDVLFHHPYDSFRPIEEFVAAAAKDPAVVGIKQTLYRVGSESPIVESLLAAAEAGKQVAVMVELKARFDESNNLIWARALERAGAHVSYGFPELKTHCKLCLIVRRESSGIRTYAHIGTGNYNPSTARQYSDLGLLTCDPEITQDIAELFNYLTGYSKQRTYRKLVVAPINLRDGVIQRIHREAAIFKKTGKGRIILKLNSLVDPEIIEALYDAAAIRVPIDLIVRGICSMRPGIPDASESVRVISVVGRFLEHSRALYFENGGDPEVLIGSADLMRRNLDRRVEVLTPIEEPELIRYIRDEILEMYFKDNTNCWVMHSDGHYRRRTASGDAAFSVQNYFMSRPATRTLMAADSEGR